MQNASQAEHLCHSANGPHDTSHCSMTHVSIGDRGGGRTVCDDQVAFHRHTALARNIDESFDVCQLTGDEAIYSVAEGIQVIVPQPARTDMTLTITLLTPVKMQRQLVSLSPEKT